MTDVSWLDGLSDVCNWQQAKCLGFVFQPFYCMITVSQVVFNLSYCLFLILKVNNKLAKCKPVSNIYDAALVVVCNQALYPFVSYLLSRVVN